MEPIKFFNRYTQKVEEEKVYGSELIHWLYNSNTGSFLSDIICRYPISQAYGFLQSTRGSSKKVDRFVQEFNINIDEYLPSNAAVSGKPYGSFNEFFIRRFKEGKRSFPEDPTKMGAFSEARYLGWEKITDDLEFPLKGHTMTAEAVLAREGVSKPFIGGPMMIARLCPVDYHRYHYPDSGTTGEEYRVSGRLHSVNPIALKYKGDTFATNERAVSILNTENFGKIAYVEVGATLVGKIVQSHPVSKPFNRGDEKGYFLFGGSTVVIFGEPGKWKPSEDILSNTKDRVETYIKLGDTVASA
ncbi:MAG: phosphatidylserine decarboxylase [Bacteriovoracaceae bacterium]|nr:phosphatidylserine decarboxylase [Bacteriovoracaceae bacterium]